MDIRVLSRDKARTYECYKPHIYISVKDPYDYEGWAKLPENKNRLHTLLLAFHDVDDRQRGYISRTKEKPNDLLDRLVLFERMHAVSIVSLVKEFMGKVDIIICQCDGGISRSPGIAAALSYIINGNDAEFFRRYSPNRRVYRIILNTWYGVRR